MAVTQQTTQQKQQTEEVHSACRALGLESLCEIDYLAVPAHN
jgi:hypothetical protein